MSGSKQSRTFVYALGGSKSPQATDSAITDWAIAVSLLYLCYHIYLCYILAVSTLLGPECSQRFLSLCSLSLISLEYGLPCVNNRLPSSLFYTSAAIVGSYVRMFSLATSFTTYETTCARYNYREKMFSPRIGCRYPAEHIEVSLCGSHSGSFSLSRFSRSC